MLVCGDLRVSLNRLARSHWAAGRTLRSWGAVPWVRRGARLLAPCAGDEALWLGAWREGDAAPPLRLGLADPTTGQRATLQVPPGYQIATLGGEPIACAGPPRSLRLELPAPAGDVELQLLAPADWAAAARRPLPAALTTEPPLPPRLG